MRFDKGFMKPKRMFFKAESFYKIADISDKRTLLIEDYMNSCKEELHDKMTYSTVYKRTK